MADKQTQKPVLAEAKRTKQTPKLKASLPRFAALFSKLDLALKELKD